MGPATTLALLLSLGAPKMHVTIVKLSASQMKTQIDKTARAQLEPLKGCYDLALQTDPKLEGELSLDFELEPGSESLTHVTFSDSSSLKDETVRACVSARLGSVPWPKPKAKNPVALTLSFAKR